MSLLDYGGVEQRLVELTRRRQSDSPVVQIGSVAAVNSSASEVSLDVTVHGATLEGLPCTVDCLLARVGDRVVVESYAHFSWVIGVIASPTTARIATEVADTGWVQVGLNDASWKHNSDYPLSVRRVGEHVYLQGGFRRDGGFQAGFVAFTLLERFRPSRALMLENHYFTSQFWTLGTNGRCTPQASDATSPGHTVWVQADWFTD